MKDDHGRYGAREAAAAFPRAALYSALNGAPAGACVREEDADRVAFAYTERHLRCVWFDPAFRPANLSAANGEPVEVENPGRWNLEAGPDFLDAALRVGGERRRLAGDVEIHIHPEDWRRHRHRADPRYRRVIAHVTWFPGCLPPGELPPGAAQIALRAALQALPAFSFEALDLAAYPYAAAEPHPPCAAILARRSAAAVADLLEAAGEERLRRKTERLAGDIRANGAAQTLYEEFMGALGYQHNRTPFRTLAATVPLAVLRSESQGAPLRAYALLCGVGGLLPDKPASDWDAETRAFVRGVWDHWWRQRSRWERQILPRRAWRLAGVRPLNHPLRRLMAAAAAFGGRTGMEALARPVQAAPKGAWWLAWLQQLQGVGLESFWATRQGLAGRRLERPVALIGAGRAAALMINAILPWMTAQRWLNEVPAALWADLPPDDDNRAVRQMAFALFGHDHHPALYRSALRRQGLIQLFTDFCLNARAGCADCPLPAALARQGRDKE